MCWAARAWPPCAFRRRRMDYMYILPSNLQVFPPEHTRRKWAHFRAKPSRNSFLHSRLRRFVSGPLQAGLCFLRHPLPAGTLSGVASFLPVFRLSYDRVTPPGPLRAYRVPLSIQGCLSVLLYPGRVVAPAVAGEGMPALGEQTGLSLLPDTLSVAFSPPLQQERVQCSLRHTILTGHPSKVQLSYA